MSVYRCVQVSLFLLVAFAHSKIAVFQQSTVIAQMGTIRLSETNILYTVSQKNCINSLL